MGDVKREMIRLYLMLSTLIYAVLTVVLTIDAGTMTILDVAVVFIFAMINVVPQGVFLALLGSLQSILPMSPFRLAGAVSCLAAALTILLWAACCSLDALRIISPPDSPSLVWTSVSVPSLIVAAALFLACLRIDRLVVLKRLAFVLGVAVVAELSVATPGVFLVSSRSGAIYYAVWNAGIGFIVGMLAAAWWMAMFVVLLYYRNLRHAARCRCLACGHDLRGLSEQRCPECGRAFTFKEIRATPFDLQFSAHAAAEASGGAAPPATPADGQGISVEDWLCSRSTDNTPPKG